MNGGEIGFGFGGGDVESNLLCWIDVVGVDGEQAMQGQTSRLSSIDDDVDFEEAGRKESANAVKSYA